MRSWVCATANTRWKACSFTRSRYSRSTATPCSRIFWRRVADGQGTSMDMPAAIRAVTERRDLRSEVVTEVMRAVAPNQAPGLFDPRRLEPLAQVLQRLGSHHALVVHGEDCVDEISVGAPTQIAELKTSRIHRYAITPEQFGLPRTDIRELMVEDAQHSLRTMRAVLANTPGPARDIVCLNAGAAIYAAGLAEDLAAGVRGAHALIASGAAQRKLDVLVAFTNGFED